ncbi:MAG: class I SAM-dependent methyltransferase [Lewinellaceae bacterium]|nr:class I SAM-dependent methyltransferase [Lewinellaceae bacterium]
MQQLFNSMAFSYATANYYSSFGFSERWRWQCVQALEWPSRPLVGFDLMSGMGECWKMIAASAKAPVMLTGVDFSEAMTQKSMLHHDRFDQLEISIANQDVLNNQIQGGNADFVLSAFGLKTFSTGQLQQLAAEICRLLKPGGQFAMVEISDPKGWWLRPLYLFYLKRLIPLIGRLFAGNSNDYRMLGIYCENFGDTRAFASMLQAEGLEVQFQRYVYGCASGVMGFKPVSPDAALVPTRATHQYHHHKQQV